MGKLYHNAPQGDNPQDETTAKLDRIAGIRNTRLNLNPSTCDPSKPIATGIRAIFDYLRVSVKMTPGEYRKFRNLIAKPKYIETFYNSPRAIGKGIKAFAHHWTAPKGITGYFNVVDENDKKVTITDSSDLEKPGTNYYIESFISIPGQYWADHRLLTQWGLIQGFKAYKKAGKLKVTRTDFAIDDFEKKLNIFQAYCDVKLGNRARFKNYQYIDSDSSKGEGETLYLGSRESDKYVRIYDTKVKHDFDAVRFECEFKGELAEFYFDIVANFWDNRTYKEEDKLNGNEYDNLYPGIVIFHNEFEYEPIDCFHGDSALDLHGQLTRIVTSICCGAIDFVDRSKVYDNGSLKNAKRLEWWESWLTYVNTATVRITVTKERTPINKTANWFQKSTAKFLRKVDLSIGLEKFMSMLREVIEAADNRMDKLDFYDIDQLSLHGVEALLTPI